jgi:hypothetical protein
MTRMPRPRLAFAAFAFLVLASCAGFRIGKDGFGFELASTRIQSEIDKRGGFPIEQSANDLAKVRVRNATLQLFPDENAIGLSIPVEVKVPFSKFSGAATVSTVPEYVASEGAIYVTRLKVRQLKIPGLPSSMEEVVGNVVTQILDLSVQRYKVHELDKKDFGQSMARLILKDVKVHPEGVFFRLGF